ncbi:MAG: hypothetical protein ACRCZ6_17655 [Kluyvera sp.]|uniref:hypothetical protein n=1 Tax=Kluyvera sp. TaxID=1538228 RepID=UPI003F392E76
MTVVNSTTSPSVSSTLPTKAVENNAQGQSQISLSDIASLLQEVFQKMRDVLQKQNVSQSVNSFKLAKSAVDKKHDSADKTSEATMLNAKFALAGGAVGGGLGLMPGLVKGAGRLAGGKNAEELTKIKNNYLEKGFSESEALEKLNEVKNKGAQKAYDFGEKSKEYGLALGPTLPGLLNGVGAMQGAAPTREASRLQTASEYLKDSQSVYDKQRDNDGNNMRQFSQKITDTARALADMHGGMVNALNWK